MGAAEEEVAGEAAGGVGAEAGCGEGERSRGALGIPGVGGSLEELETMMMIGGRGDYKKDFIYFLILEWDNRTCNKHLDHDLLTIGNPNELREEYQGRAPVWAVRIVYSSD